MINGFFTFGLRIIILLIQNIQQNIYMVNKNTVTSGLNQKIDVLENCLHSVCVFICNQSEMRFWHVKIRDKQHKSSLKKYQKAVETG